MKKKRATQLDPRHLEVYHQPDHELAPRLNPRFPTTIETLKERVWAFQIFYCNQAIIVRHKRSKPKRFYIINNHITIIIMILKVHKIEIFFGFDFEICIISLLVM
jgi:hypothetical protein